MRGDLSDPYEVETVEDSREARRGDAATRVQVAAQPQVIQVRTATLGPALDQQLSRQHIDLHLKSILSVPDANKTHEALEARFSKNDEYTLRISNML